MKVIIMAAGVGSRISADIEGLPKCILPIDKMPLIRRTVSEFLEYDFEVIVVVGYQKEKVIESISDLPVKIIENPFYRITNSIASLWFAKDYLIEDTIIMNGDVFVTSKIIKQIIHSDKSPLMLMDNTRIENGDYYLGVEKNCITHYGKNLPLSQRSGEYVGLAKVKSKDIVDFRENLIKLIDKECFYYWWEDTLYDLADEQQEVYVEDVNNCYWSEIDFLTDYEKILTKFNEQF
ncbi:Choline kinase [Pelagirhabdus alkalitolerans]|uniref:Choline kinase n=1 Tax=Pelagirhabdus alkalitolerans TaxID=1612202 RepID=A0A1G6L5C6_9BACI|nr:phosphocholine cytidylyltransferase family protein [Pelagirhabdus alkalitolerans]SDC38529.1 Choline kinase [Pelagirhabdus alkalitolerans]